MQHIHTLAISLHGAGVRRATRWLLAAMLALWLALGWAQSLQPVPALSARVIDQTSTLSTEELAAISGKLEAYEKKQGSQIVVLMVPTTQPEDISAYAYRVASTWKIGRRTVGDGLLLVIAKDDRRMRLEVSRALEGAVPDIAAAAIIDQIMAPQFRNGHYAAGILTAIDHISARIDGEALPLPGSERPQAAAAGQVDWVTAGVLVVMGSLIGSSVLRALLGRPLGALATGAAAGGLMFLLTGVLLAAGLAALVGLLVGLLGGMSGGGGGGGRGGGGGGGMMPPPGGGSRHGGPIILPPGSHSGWGRGDGFGGGGFGGGFGSGGGGSFGGGGASGGW